MSPADMEESRLPRYGLAGAFDGTRWIDGESRDLCEIGHRPAGSREKLSVVTGRRTTARRARGGPGVAVSADVARESVADALVVPTWRRGDDNVFAVIKKVAGDVQAWKAREIKFDGRLVAAWEREYRERWVVYHLTRALVVFVAAPVALRPNVIEIRRLEDSELTAGEGEAE